jgi:TonB family protein
MKRAIVVAMLLWASAVAGEESDPVLASCSITNNVLTCGAMGILFPIPEQWFVAPEGPVPVKLFQGGYRLLIADKHVGFPVRNRMIIVADDYASVPTHYSVEKYVNRMAQNLVKQQNGELLRDAAVEKHGTVEFYRADLKNTDQGVVLYKSVIATEANGYYLVWNFVTGSPDQLKESIQSLEHLVIAKIPIRAKLVSENTASPAPPTPAKLAVPVPDGKRPLRVRVSQGVSENMLIYSPQPKYPEEARKQRIEGFVVLKALIGTDGTVKELSHVKGDLLLAESALAAVRRWRYKPYFLNGAPVEVETNITVNYVMSIKTPGRDKRNSQPASPTGN